MSSPHTAREKMSWPGGIAHTCNGGGIQKAETRGKNSGPAKAIQTPGKNRKRDREGESLAKIT